MAPVIEQRSIDVVPAAERHGRPWNQFTLWFGANMQITAIVDGALAVVFGADPLWAIVGVLLGNVLGGIVMALHSAQGPRLGLPQMISSRAQFGVVGAIVPLLLVVLMYLGFAATGTVLSGQAINAMTGIGSPAFGIVAFGVITAVVAVVGYRWIHGLGRVATVLGALGFTYLLVRIVTQHDVGALFGRKPFDVATFLLAVSLGAGWQLTFGPYVADYSRYLPRETKESTTFWSTLAGSVIGSQWSMTIGAIVAALPVAAGHKDFLANQVGYIGDLAGAGLVAGVIYLVIVVGKLTVNCLNAYGGSMTMLTIATALSPRARVGKIARAAFIVGFLAVSVLIALVASADFLKTFKNFVLVLLMVFTPWSAINLVDYYLVSKERVDIPALYDPRGRYGAFNWMALGVYALGIVAQIPFLAQTLYTGALVDALGGADVSWIVGLLLTGAVYYPLAKRQRRWPEHTIQPDGIGL